MKTLNRPMFKNGGPIKEGIMSGMKEPQMSNTVGSPFAPQDSSGRQKYAVQFAPLLLAAGRALARPLGKFATRAVQRTFAGPNKRFYEPAGFSKNVKESVFQPNVAGKYLMGSPEFKAGKAIVQGSGKFGAPIKKVAKGIVSSPLTAGSILYYGGGALLPDGTPDPEDPKNYKPAGEGGKSGAPGGGDPGMYLAPRQSKEELDKITEDRIEANRKKYYKLMGIDKMKKGAVYDSLIDASQIIQEQGGDLKGAIKSGTLQSSIINAISKNLDKSTDLKKQIDAAILKGEITKDIEQSKVPDSIRTARMLGISDAEYKDKILGNTNLKDNLIAAYNKQGSFPAGNQLAAFARNDGIKIDGVEDSQEVKKWIEANSSNEEGYIQSIVKEGKVPNGTYVINNRIFNVNGQDITSIV
jgi:hypothetical protein